MQLTGFPALCSCRFVLHGYSSGSFYQSLMRLLYGRAANLFGIRFLVDSMVLFLGVSIFFYTYQWYAGLLAYCCFVYSLYLPVVYGFVRILSSLHLTVQ